MNVGMQIEDFAERLDALGPDLTRWPASAAGEAQALIARSGAARRLHADARLLASLVEEAARGEAPNGFAFRVVADVAARRSDRLLRLTGSPGRFGLAGASFAAIALALGVALGAVSMTAQAGPSDLFDLGGVFSLSLSDGDF